MIGALPNIDLISKRDKPKNESSERLNGFINILTTQLQNQDPTAPMESSDLSQLLSGLVMVEQNSSSNLYLKQLIDLQKEAANHATANTDARLSGVVSYLGRSITADCDRAQLTSDGANFTYNLDKNASQVMVRVTDQNHQVIFEQDLGSRKAGLNKFLWPGENGNINGDYHLQVYAVDQHGRKVDTTYEVTGRVEGLEIANKQKIYLTLDDNSVIDLSQVSSVF